MTSGELIEFRAGADKAGSNFGTGCLPRPELLTMLATFVGVWVFFSGVDYTRLQYNTGVRYLASMLPFLFLPAVMLLLRLPRPVRVSVVAVCMSKLPETLSRLL